MFAISVKEKFETTSTHDGLVIGLCADEEIHNGLNHNNAWYDQMNVLQKEKKMNTEAGACTKIHSFGTLQTDAVYVVGLGKKTERTKEQLRNSLAKLSAQLKADNVTDVAIYIPSFTSVQLTDVEVARLIGEGITLGQYEVETYKEKKDREQTLLSKLTLYGIKEEHKSAMERAVSIGMVYGKGTNKARALVNVPGNMLTPTKLAKEAEHIATTHQFTFNVLDEKEMEQAGMNALLAVAQGSDEPAKMIALTYEGNPQSDEIIGLVGKGLTFDTGGISLKPSKDMHEMKMDMGGAAAVLGAMDIIGTLQPKVNVVAVIPSTENLMNGSALKPGDVIQSLHGKTIEVRNTDAEGRLILADGMTYCKQLGATSLIDVATLTGAVLIALGDCTTGAVTNDEKFMNEVLRAADETDEYIWQFPHFEPYKKMVRSSDVADLNNAPGRLAGSITAGLFIGEFAENTPWVHLDIAGTAWQSKKSALGPSGGTGVMARTLATVVMNKENNEH